MNSFSLILVVFVFVVLSTIVELSQSSDETVGTHICYYLNKEEEVYIPIAAIFGYPKEKRLLIFDYLGMYYEVGGNGDDGAIRISPDRGVRVSLEKAFTGQWAVKWPGLTSVVAEDTEAIDYKGKSWFCFFNKTEDGKHTGKCFSKNDTDSLEFNESLLKNATSGDFHERFQSLIKCRVKSSLQSNGEFTMQFIEKANVEVAIKNNTLECPVVWRTTEAFNATLFEYDGVVLIINLLYAYAFRRSDVIAGGSTIVSRIPLKHLFHCDPKMIIRRETFLLGLSLQSFLLIFVGAFFALIVLLEIAYIAGIFESQEPAFSDEQVAKGKSKRGKKRKKKKRPAKKRTKQYIESVIDAASLEPVPSVTPSQVQEMPEGDDEETAENEPAENSTKVYICPHCCQRSSL